MILAAGLGTRLKPLTDTLPKALVLLDGRPMIERLILKLKQAGFGEIVVNIHHLGEQIVDFLNENHNFGLKIKISDERDYLLDTGGAIKHAAAYFDDEKPFLVHNVDIISDVDLRALYESHLQANPLATLLVSKRESSRYLLFNRENRLCGWRNRDTGEVKSHFPDFDVDKHIEYAFGGIHVLSPEIFKWMEEWTGKFSIIDFYLSVCARADILAYPAQDINLIDVGKASSLERAEEWLRGEAPDGSFKAS